MEVKRSTILDAGLGVFATKNYAKDDLIERSAFIVLYETPDRLNGHVFAGAIETEGLVYFGKMTLVNHKEEENTYHCMETGSRFIEFYCKTAIVKGDEFFMNYGKDTKF